MAILVLPDGEPKGVFSTPDTSVPAESTRIPVTPGPRETAQEIPGEIWTAIQAAKKNRNKRPDPKDNMWATPKNPFYYKNFDEYGRVVAGGFGAMLDALSEDLRGSLNTPKGRGKE